MFKRKSKEELVGQLDSVNEKRAKDHKKQFRTSEEDFNLNEKELKQTKKQEFATYKKELKKVIIIKKEFSRQLKENIDFDLEFFEGLKKDQPKLFKYLADMPSCQKIVKDAFIRASKYNFLDHANDLKKVFSISDDIFENQDYIKGIQEGFLYNLNEESFEAAEKMISNNKNFPFEIFKNPEIINSLAGAKEKLENQKIKNENEEKGLQLLSSIEKHFPNK